MAGSVRVRYFSTTRASLPCATSTHTSEYDIAYWALWHLHPLQSATTVAVPPQGVARTEENTSLPGLQYVLQTLLTERQEQTPLDCILIAHLEAGNITIALRLSVFVRTKHQKLRIQHLGPLLTLAN